MRIEVGDTSRGKEKETIKIRDEEEEEQDGGSIGKESETESMTEGRPALAIHERYKGQDLKIEELKKALESKKEDLRVAPGACDLNQVDFQRVGGERVATENQARNAEEVTDVLRATRSQEVKVARERGFDNGFDAAGVEYKKQVWEIEAELHRDCFRDGHRCDYELLLSKLNLPEDLKLCVVLESPPKELVLPLEEEDEVVQNLDAQANPVDPVEPMSDAAFDAQE
ncbi:hypothetical protein RHMOL_Rhmol04G0224600 [Rhododendron molle]|uniref:Uncharacterized protein n=1 Tax=Rhododendron molle TaxID=49168 RepID=A0ACC0P328_RHOML|nr:hypothetical protein RHMOL_Rhmol04G0224600 [Rhododendron molle]